MLRIFALPVRGACLQMLTLCSQPTPGDCRVRGGGFFLSIWGQKLVLPTGQFKQRSGEEMPSSAALRAGPQRITDNRPRIPWLPTSTDLDSGSFQRLSLLRRLHCSFPQLCIYVN